MKGGKHGVGKSHFERLTSKFARGSSSSESTPSPISSLFLDDLEEEEDGVEDGFLSKQKRVS